MRDYAPQNLRRYSMPYWYKWKCSVKTLVSGLKLPRWKAMPRGLLQDRWQQLVRSGNIPIIALTCKYSTSLDIYIILYFIYIYIIIYMCVCNFIHIYIYICNFIYIYIHVCVCAPHVILHEIVSHPSSFWIYVYKRKDNMAIQHCNGTGGEFEHQFESHLVIHVSWLQDPPFSFHGHRCC